MEKNYCIRCDVTKCRHNAGGNNCALSSITVTCGEGEQCTCCQDFASRSDCEECK